MLSWFKSLFSRAATPTPDVPGYDPLTSIKVTAVDKTAGLVLPLAKPAPIVQSKMKISDNGLKLLQQFEGFRAKAYQCSAGIWTIGWGHTSAAGLPKVYKGMTTDKAGALAMLKRDLVQYEQAVIKNVKCSLTQNEFDALVSFCYNVGVHGFAASSVVRYLNTGRKDQVGAGFAMWVKAGGKTVKGLVNRRAAETKLFYSK